MFKRFSTWLNGKTAPHRVMLTPGRLFFLMSQELRQSRPKGRCICSMPLPFAVAPDEGGANWDAQPGMMQCPDCTESAREILEKYRRLYDMNTLELGGEAPPRAPDRGNAPPSLDPFESVRAFG